MRQAHRDFCYEYWVIKTVGLCASTQQKSLLPPIDGMLLCIDCVRRLMNSRCCFILLCPRNRNKNPLKWKEKNAHDSCCFFAHHGGPLWMGMRQRWSGDTVPRVFSVLCYCFRKPWFNVVCVRFNIYPFRFDFLLFVSCCCFVCIIAVEARRMRAVLTPRPAHGKWKVLMAHMGRFHCS